MFCKYCGKEISNDSKFCRYCGKALEQNSQQETEIKNIKEIEKIENQTQITTVDPSVTLSNNNSKDVNDHSINNSWYYLLWFSPLIVTVIFFITVEILINNSGLYISLLPICMFGIKLFIVIALILFCLFDRVQVEKFSRQKISFGVLSIIAILLFDVLYADRYLYNRKKVVQETKRYPFYINLIIALFLFFFALYQVNLFARSSLDKLSAFEHPRSTLNKQSPRTSIEPIVDNWSNEYQKLIDNWQVDEEFSEDGNEYLKNYFGNRYGFDRYVLDDVDGDQIPEFILLSDSMHLAHIYTVVNGKLTKIRYEENLLGINHKNKALVTRGHLIGSGGSYDEEYQILQFASGMEPIYRYYFDHLYDNYIATSSLYNDDSNYVEHKKTREAYENYKKTFLEDLTLISSLESHKLKKIESTNNQSNSIALSLIKSIYSNGIWVDLTFSDFLNNYGDPQFKKIYSCMEKESEGYIFLDTDPISFFSQDPDPNTKISIGMTPSVNPNEEIITVKAEVDVFSEASYVFSCDKERCLITDFIYPEMGSLKNAIFKDYPKCKKF